MIRIICEKDLRVIFVTVLLATVNSVTSVKELLQVKKDTPRIRGNRFVIFDTSSDMKAKLSTVDELKTTDIVDGNQYDFGRQHHVSKRKRLGDKSMHTIESIQTKAKLSTAGNSKMTDLVDVNQYDFGRHHHVSKRKDNTVRLRKDKIMNKTQQHASSWTSKSKPNTQMKSNLDVDIEYLESFLLSKLKKKTHDSENHSSLSNKSDTTKKSQHTVHNKRSKNTKEHSQPTVEDDLERLLEYSLDESYSYTSVPTPAPMTNSYHPTVTSSISTISPTTHSSEGEVPTSSNAPSISLTATITELPTMNDGAKQTNSPTLLASEGDVEVTLMPTTAVTDITTASPTSNNSELTTRLPSNSPSAKISISTMEPTKPSGAMPIPITPSTPSPNGPETMSPTSGSSSSSSSLPTETPTIPKEDATSTPTSVTTSATDGSFSTFYPTSSTYYPTSKTYAPTPTTYAPTYGTNIPTYLNTESGLEPELGLPTFTPTVSPTYLTSVSSPSLSPTYLATENGLTRNNPCPDVLSKSEQLLDDLTLSYDTIEDNGRLVFCSELEYDGEGWLGLGVSETGEMISSTAVIGLPDNNEDTNPGLYSLDGKTNSLVRLLPEEEQTLLDASIVQENGVTVLKFATYVDDDNFAIKVPGVTTFIYSASDSNDFGYHGMRRGSVSLVLSTAKSLKRKEKKGSSGRI